MTVLSWALVWGLGCARPTPKPQVAVQAKPAVERLVAIGDVHGDMNAALRALRIAGVTDEEGRWVGGRTIAVQVGDVLDRGDDERAILDWFERLRDEARAAGGAFHPLLGNHELMNVAGDLRYVTPGGLAAFADVPASPRGTAAALSEDVRGRVAAFEPGGPYARQLADHRVAIVIDRVVFVHGGLTAAHAAYGIDRMNQEVSAWLSNTSSAPAWVTRSDGPLWMRDYSSGDPDCGMLSQALAALDADMMVVAHTPQSQGPNAMCEGRVWRVDVGMSRAYGGVPAAWERTADGVRVLR